jgi:hypothetical protein
VAPADAFQFSVIWPFPGVAVKPVGTGGAVMIGVAVTVALLADSAILLTSTGMLEAQFHL